MIELVTATCIWSLWINFGFLVSTLISWSKWPGNWSPANQRHDIISSYLFNPSGHESGAAVKTGPWPHNMCVCGTHSHYYLVNQYTASTLDCFTTNLKAYMTGTLLYWPVCWHGSKTTGCVIKTVHCIMFSQLIILPITFFKAIKELQLITLILSLHSTLLGQIRGPDLGYSRTWFHSAPKYMKMSPNLPCQPH